MPWLQPAFSTLGTVRCLPGREITASDLREADVLLVRSVTRVDATLLAESPVRFVGTATIGTDHIDRAFLKKCGIAFAHAPGCNAESVVEFVLAALLHTAVEKGESLRGKTVGIVGCGNIGGRLATRLPWLGVRVLKNDPPLAAQASEPHDFVSLDTVLVESDILTLHMPLTHQDPHATYHLFDKTTLNRIKPDAWLLNTARGAVLSNEALKEMLQAERMGASILDVWENEPTPDPELLQIVNLAAPHIAGHSYDGKVRGTIMLYDALLAFLNQESQWDTSLPFAPGPDDHLILSPPDPSLSEVAWLNDLVKQMYDITADDQRIRKLLHQPYDEQGPYFSRLRQQYPRRRAFSLHSISRNEVPAPYQDVVAKGLQVRLLD